MLSTVCVCVCVCACLFAGVLGFNVYNGKNTVATVPLKREDDYYNFEINLEHTNNHKCVFDSDSSQFFFEDSDRSLYDLIMKKTKNCKAANAENTLICNRQTIKMVNPDDRTEFFGKYGPNVNCMIGIEGVTTPGFFFHKKIISFEQQPLQTANAIMTIYNYTYFKDQATQVPGNDKPLLDAMTPQSFVADPNWFPKGSAAFQFNMSSHYTRMGEAVGTSFITNYLFKSNDGAFPHPGCVGFEEIVKQAVKDKKIINKNIEIQNTDGTTKNFWSDCGEMLMSKNRGNSFKFWVISNKKKMVQASMLYINDNFRKPLKELSEEELITDPWTFQIDPKCEHRKMFLGMSFVTGNLVFFPVVSATGGEVTAFRIHFLYLEEKSTE
eukprot:GHVR01092685.1.p1 GENE.GHVR01092685.1~~GHVR01092685.1.p1  ORF type:complete len:382 (+),score=53.66 GHVR01092685.1:416-1561(+)